MTRLLERQRRACQALLDDLHAQTDVTERPYDEMVLQFRIGQLTHIQAWLDLCEQRLIVP